MYIYMRVCVCVCEYVFIYLILEYLQINSSKDSGKTLLLNWVTKTRSPFPLHLTMIFETQTLFQSDLEQIGRDGIVPGKPSNVAWDEPEVLKMYFNITRGHW